MIRRRAEDAGIRAKIACHLFATTGITAYLKSAAGRQWPADHHAPSLAGDWPLRIDGATGFLSTRLKGHPFEK
jgi:hypothetical protein